MTGKRKNKSLLWSSTKSEDKGKNWGWSEDAKDHHGNIVYQIYYDNDSKLIYLQDKIHDVRYTVPLGSKAKGYTLAK